MGIWVFLAVLILLLHLRLLFWIHGAIGCYSGGNQSRRKENLLREYSRITLFWVDSYSDTLSAGTICIIATELEEALAICLIEADP